MSKSIPKIYALRPGRALAILDYLLYLDTTNECTRQNAEKDGITKPEWDATQMYIKSKNRSGLPKLKDKLNSMRLYCEPYNNQLTIIND